jgi:hypothetical protein
MKMKTQEIFALFDARHPWRAPAGALRASNFVPDKIVRLCSENSYK